MNDSSGKGSLIGPVFAFLAAAGGLTIDSFGFIQWQSEQWTNSFVPTTAQVTRSQTSRYQSVRGGVWYDTTVDFEYQGKDGTTQRQRRIVRPSFFVEHVDSGQDWDKTLWKPGTPFTVFVDPERSDVWSESKGTSELTYTILALGTILFIGGAVTFYPTIFRLFADDSADEYEEFSDKHDIN